MNDSKLWFWSTKKLYIIFVFYFLIIMFILCYWFDQKAGIFFYWLLLFLIRIKFGHTQVSVPKICMPMSKTACINPCPTICDLILRFPALLLGLYFMGPKVYPILVQLSTTFFLIVLKTYLILVFLKTGLKNGNLKIIPAAFATHTFLESPLHRLLLW